MHRATHLTCYISLSENTELSIAAWQNSAMELSLTIMTFHKSKVILNKSHVLKITFEKSYHMTIRSADAGLKRHVPFLFRMRNYGSSFIGGTIGTLSYQTLPRVAKVFISLVTPHTFWRL
jgi:hypothetical protein